MSGFSLRSWFACVAVVLSASFGAAQDDPGALLTRAVNFPTADGVTLRGKLYRSLRDKEASPAVLLLHNLGPTEHSNKPAWVKLAKELQKNFTVLAFDFRGHGESTEVDGSLYFQYKVNQQATPTYVANKKLTYKDIKPGYYPLLINDIAAAKSYLERAVNDIGQCNTQNMIVIGAEQGATLGAIWVNSEFYRFRVTYDPMLVLPAPRFDKLAEGRWFSGLIWLSISPKLGMRDIALTRVHDVPCRVNSVPTLFLHGADDKRSDDAAKAVDKGLKSVLVGTKKDDKKLRVPRIEAIPGTKLAGDLLIQDSLKTAPILAKWATEQAQASSNEWAAREFKSTLYAWRFTLNGPVYPARLMPANIGGFGGTNPFRNQNTPNIPEAVEKNLLFDTYERMIPSK